MASSPRLPFNFIHSIIYILLFAQRGPKRTHHHHHPDASTEPLLLRFCGTLRPKKASGDGCQAVGYKSQHGMRLRSKFQMAVDSKLVIFSSGVFQSLSTAVNRASGT